MCYLLWLRRHGLGFRCTRRVSRQQVRDWHSLPSPGSGRFPFPCFKGTMKCSDFLRPSRQLRFLRCALPGGASASSLPAVQNANRGPGVLGPVPAAGLCRLETIRTSQVSGEPLCLCALFYDPGRISCTLPKRCADAAPAMSTTKAPTISQLSRLNHTALRLTVYASPDVLPHRTQNSFPAAGQALPDGIANPQGSNERFLRCSLYIPVLLPQTYLAQGHSGLFLND